MTLYALILFSHIAGAFFLFAGLALEWMAVRHFRRNLDPAQTGLWIHLAVLAPRFYGPALGVILFSGAYLASQMGGNQGWTLVSLVTLIIIGLVGAVVTAPRVRAIRKLAANEGDRLSFELQNRLKDTVLPASVRLRLALVFGVVLLMVSKVDLRFSLVTIACAVSLGLAAALPLWRRSSIPGAKLGA